MTFSLLFGVAPPGLYRPAACASPGVLAHVMKPAQAFTVSEAVVRPVLIDVMRLQTALMRTVSLASLTANQPRPN
jgi:hypothetical protein